ncbi:L-arabinolactonase [Caballeronia sordidicola]|uniref:L-arabinolactonase n=1 Tax=Caballeronia sordidicola TaxID=196367 RepID=A0A242MZ77_CABSO|nr:L-arabinolactonase [Caballeronia sordidicola]
MYRCRTAARASCTRRIVPCR